MAPRKKKTSVEEVAEVKVESKFSKSQLINSQRFSKRRDLLNAVLKDDEQYSIAEAQAAIDKFMKGKVK